MQLRKPISTSSLAIKHLPLQPATAEVRGGEQLKSLLPHQNCIPVTMTVPGLQNNTKNTQLPSSGITLNLCPLRKTLRNTDQAAGVHVSQKHSHNEEIFIWACTVNSGCHDSFYHSIDKLTQRHYKFELESK